MKPESPRPDVWQVIVGPEHGGLVQAIVSATMHIPPDVFADAINRIERETTLGPLLNPTAYVGGERFRNADHYKNVLMDLRRLRETLGSIVREEA